MRVNTIGCNLYNVEHCANTEKTLSVWTKKFLFFVAGLSRLVVKKKSGTFLLTLVFKTSPISRWLSKKGH